MKTGPFKTLAVGLPWVWVAVFGAAPILIMLLASLSPEGLFPAGGRVTLDAYGRLMEPMHVSIFLDSLLLSGTVTLACLLGGYPFAAILAGAPRGLRGLLLLLVVIPFWTNSLVRTYAMIAILNAGGLLNKLLLGLGIIDAPLRMMYTRGATMAGLAYTLLPFMVLPLYAALEKLDRRYVEAARDLGAGPWSTFRHVIWPLTMPGVVTGCMMVFLPALGMFYVPDVLGGARSVLIGNFIRDQFLVTRDWPMGAAAGMGLTLLMALMLLARRHAARFQRHRRRA